MEIDFEKIYSVCVKALRFNRTHPEIPRDKKWFREFILMFCLYTFVYLAFVYNMGLALKIKNYTEATKIGSISVIYIVVCFQYAILIIKQKTLMKIICMMKDDFQKNMPDDEKKIVLEFAKKGSNVCRQWLYTAIITGLLFFIKHIILELYLYFIGEFEIIMAYPLTFPEPLESVKMHPIVYSLIYILLVYHVFFAACLFVCYPPMGPLFMLHACGQLEIVKKKALSLSEIKDENDFKPKLVDIAKHLQYIYGFVDCINDSLRLFYELTLKGSTLGVTVTLFQILSSFKRNEFSVEFITIVFAAVLMSSSPCYYGDMLMEKSENVRQAIYFCGWENLFDYRNRKIILIILQRTLRPTAVCTIFRKICLDALTDLFHQSYALFNLMNTMWE